MNEIKINKQYLNYKMIIYNTTCEVFNVRYNDTQLGRNTEYP